MFSSKKKSIKKEIKTPDKTGLKELLKKGGRLTTKEKKELLSLVGD